MSATKIPKRSKQSELGQFFTPTAVADFMASMFDTFPKSMRILDAGAGAGALTRAVIDRCCKADKGVRAIHATLYERDTSLAQRLAAMAEECQQGCRLAGIQFSCDIRLTDFIQEAATRPARRLFGNELETFDVAIVNPPYRKIHSESQERRWLRTIGIETSNLYTAFLALIFRTLSRGGQLVAITPRSFCNGPYFRPFRRDLLRKMALRNIHVFDSRRAAFRQDKVLQENIIFHAIRGGSHAETIAISSSSGESPGEITRLVVPFSEVVAADDPERFIHIPTLESHANAKGVMSGLDSTLASLDVIVSTGRVVDFRLRSAIRMEPESGTVPLIYPCHFNGGTVHWPNLQGRKPNAIIDSSETRPWLVPNGVYLLVKRFTAKEEARRVVACLLDPSSFQVERIGIENHLNYFHTAGKGLNRNLAVGLFLFLNSTVVDQYFRRFSGHTQVNATDLRGLPYPRKEVVEAMGRELPVLAATQTQIDQIVQKYVHGKR